MSTKKRVAIVEIGGSHDECILSQLIALKNEGAWVAFCSTKQMFEKNSQFAHLIDEFYEVKLVGKGWQDFKTIYQLNRWFTKKGIQTVVCNTAQGGHVRNLALTASKKIKFVGVVHTIKMLQESFTQKLISLKIKDYFLLNTELVRLAPKTQGLRLYAFYPLVYPHFDVEVSKSSSDFWVAIIGGVEFRRKDLSGFIEMALQMPQHVQFIFLGKTDENLQEVQSFLDDIKQAGLEKRVKIFTEFVSEELFDAYLKKVDAIFPLVHPNTASAQEYLRRQISGAMNVAFSYKIPLLIHEAYEHWEDFQSGVVFYKRANFVEQIHVLMEQTDRLREALKSNSKFDPIFQAKVYTDVVMK